MLKSSEKDIGFVAEFDVNSPCSSFVFVKEHIVPPSHLKPQEADFPRCGLLTFLAAEKQVGPV